MTDEPRARALAAERASARAARDFAAADRLRDEIAGLGWVVRDEATGWVLRPAPGYPVLPSVAALPDRSGEPDSHPATVSVLAEGWPEDLRGCARALLETLPPEIRLQLLDVGDRDGAGDVVHELAVGAPGRVAEFHVARDDGWGAARRALLRADTAAVHIWCDSSVLFGGDAASPLLAELADPGVVGAGWRGVNVDLADGWRSFIDAGPGEVDALLGYLFAMRRSAALAAGGPDRAARFYRNADLEWSFRLREVSGGRLVVPAGELPVRQGRHRGYHDSDPVLRDRESRRNYQRFLRRYRGRAELLSRRHGK